VATKDVWPVVAQLADVWSQSELVQEFLAQHPERTDDTGAVTEALRNMQAGTWLLTEAPLLTTMWEPLAAQLPLVQVNDELRAYLRTVQPLGQVLESTVCWVRSRMPLYPHIPAPQFASRGYRRTEKAGKRLSWRQQCLAAGLEAEPSPPAVARILHLDEAVVASVSNEVLRTLMSSEEWESYASLTESLTTDDLDALADARRRVNVLLNPRNVNEYENSRMERRHAYRREQVQNVVDALEGTPKHLAIAFEAIDDLIDHALVNVHGQLVVSGSPTSVEPEALEVDGIEVSFRYSGDIAPGVGSSVRLSDPLVPEVVLISDIGFQFGQPDFNGLKYRGKRLPSSEHAFATD
jgi:hypothetical protein